jgi:cytochrome c peroxidase
MQQDIHTPTKRSHSSQLMPMMLLTTVLIVLSSCGMDTTRLAPSSSTTLQLNATDAILPLSQIAIPQPSGGDIINTTAAVQLGKALFWDVQVGGDGNTACATCHYSTGADTRTNNSINPGGNGIFEALGVTGLGQLFSLTTFNFDDVVGSQGVIAGTFIGVHSDPTVAADVCDYSGTVVMHRQVTGRQAPSVLGAVFNRDNFWDGRANHNFNGVNPFGSTGNFSGTALVNMTNSSLASQADGPANNPVEMACGGRPFNGANSLGAKMLARQPLGHQMVSATDGVLGGLAASSLNPTAPGLNTTYSAMIATAFGQTLADTAVDQFSRIFGQAVQAYEATLNPDQTPFDRFLAGNLTAISVRQKTGFGVFKGKGACQKCHAGSELSDATVGFAAVNSPLNEDGGDQGFHNIGLRPTTDDLGRANQGPNGVPWSVSCARDASGACVVGAKDRGAFKTPQLRNVKLSAPYFHTGNKATIADVVEFYNRGGDFANPEKGKRITKIGLGQTDKDALVDFLTNALTDCRTEKQRAPFDHPALPLPNGTDLSATGAAGLGACP